MFVGHRCLKLAQELLSEGFAGEIKLVSSYPLGAQQVLNQQMSMAISGFSKDGIKYFVEEEDGYMTRIGRYRAECRKADFFTVEDLVEDAWDCYRRDKDRGFQLPHEWVPLFLKHGYLKKEVQTVLVEKEDCKRPRLGSFFFPLS